jgi:hypothetical protein
MGLAVAITINATVHVYGNPVELVQRLDQIAGMLSTLQTLGVSQMATLDQVLQDVADESSQIDSLSTLTAALKQQVQDALAGVTLPPAVQAKVDAVFTGIESNKQKVVDAINANTPAATADTGGTPTPTPTPDGTATT